MLEQGLPHAEVARLFGVHPNTVSKWVRRARAGGRVTLAAGRRGRRAGEQLALAPYLVKATETVELAKQFIGTVDKVNDHSRRVD